MKVYAIITHKSTVIGFSLHGEAEGEGVFNQSIVEEPVIRGIIPRFGHPHPLVTIDIEDVE